MPSRRKKLTTDAELQQQATTEHHEVLADTQLVPASQQIVPESQPEFLDPATDFDPAKLDAQTPSATVNQIVQGVADSTRIPTGPAPDPHDIQTVVTEDNAVHLGSSHRQRAYFIRFNRKPEGENGQKHPALLALQDAGFRWREVGDGSFAWKKPWVDNGFSHVEEQAARQLVNRVGELLGGVVRNEERVPQ
jgi:hypothetical protein